MAQYEYRHESIMLYPLIAHSLGYVQGMNDLMVPIITLFGDDQDEHIAFWFFAGRTLACFESLFLTPPREN